MALPARRREERRPRPSSAAPRPQRQREELSTSGSFDRDLLSSVESSFEMQQESPTKDGPATAIPRGPSESNATSLAIDRRAFRRVRPRSVAAAPVVEPLEGLPSAEPLDADSTQLPIWYQALQRHEDLAADFEDGYFSCRRDFGGELGSYYIDDDVDDDVDDDDDDDEGEAVEDDVRAPLDEAPEPRTTTTTIKTKSKTNPTTTKKKTATAKAANTRKTSLRRASQPPGGYYNNVDFDVDVDRDVGYDRDPGLCDGGAGYFDYDYDAGHGFVYDNGYGHGRDGGRMGQGRARGVGGRLGYDLDGIPEVDADQSTASSSTSTPSRSSVGMQRNPGWLAPTPQRSRPRADPVRRGAEMRQLWSKDKFLKSSGQRKFDLRHCGPPEHEGPSAPRRPLLIPHFVPPHEKSRHDIRLQVRQQLLMGGFQG